MLFHCFCFSLFGRDEDDEALLNVSLLVIVEQMVFIYVPTRSELQFGSRTNTRTRSDNEGFHVQTLKYWDTYRIATL